MQKFMFLLLLVLFQLFTAFTCHAVTVENPRDDIYVSPGGTAQTKFNVVNRSNRPQSMKVILSDYKFKADGTNEFPPAGSSERSNAGWLKFAPESFTIMPGTTVEINVQITAPNKPLEGTYWRMLMVEYVDQQDANKRNTEGEIVSGIRVIRRQGVQLRTHITGTGEKKARLFNKNITRKNDRLFFEIDLENTGTLFYRGDFWVELFNQEGYPAGKVQLAPMGVYPGCSVRFVADISQFKKGKYTALCVFDTRSNKVFGGKYQVEIP